MIKVYVRQLSERLYLPRNGMFEKYDLGMTSKRQGQIDEPPRAGRRTLLTRHLRRILNEVTSRQSCADGRHSCAT